MGIQNGSGEHYSAQVDAAPGVSLLVGRGEQCDVRLEDPSASRIHCRITAGHGFLRLTDEGSRWGTLVNGRQVAECDLKPGDRVTVGESLLTVFWSGGAADTTLVPRSELQRPEGVSVSDHLFAPVGDDSVAREDSPENPRVHNSKQDAFRNDTPPAVEVDQLLGQTFHGYRIRQHLASASTGVVFLAYETTGNRPVALKLFHPDVFSDSTAVQRFDRAISTMIGKQHPSIVELYNAGRSDGWVFTASQYVAGESAVSLIQRIGIVGMLEPSIVVQMALDLCEALRFAEQQRIVHRNIKPSNILVRSADRRALLNDLVLAKATTRSDAHRLTQPGDILGDIRYLPPEQVGSGHLLDHRSDIYQLGATVYALLTGRPPVDGHSVADTVNNILTATPASIRCSHMSVPAQFESVVMKMLARNPGDRFGSADELSVALRKVAAEIPGRHPRSCDADPHATGWGGALDGMFS
ncbi:MAG: protein kinase [Planctomycetaceae bacterium]|nr:protein kinase [Planctomycetaceae bacterium]